MTHIFLSASVPHRAPWVANGDPTAVREAVLALVEVAGGEHRIVFGGHPAVTPMVEHAARSLGVLQNITIFQSRFFEDRVPLEALKLPHLVWTDAVEGDLQQSLAHMRMRMLEYAPYDMAVFVGGMEGVIDEWLMLNTGVARPQVPLSFPIGSTGSAAAALLDIVDDFNRDYRLIASFAVDSPKEILYDGQDEFMRRFDAGEKPTAVHHALARTIRFLRENPSSPLQLRAWNDRKLTQELRNDTDYRRLLVKLIRTQLHKD